MAAVGASGLPAVTGPSDPPRPKLAFGAPLPIGMTAEAELIDLFLVERRPRWQVREALEPLLPAGWRLVDLSDVWLGGPALAGLVAAADYRIVLDAAEGVAASDVDGAAKGATAPDVARAASALLAAASLPRQREKGGGSVEYDLRPLLLAVEVADTGPPVVVRTRTRFHPSLGTGRPEEVVAALADQLGRPLTVVSIVRERLILADELA